MKSEYVGRIENHEVSFHPHSFGDAAGRLFRWNGELYRGIRSAWVPVFKRIVQNGVIDRLVQRGLLIQTETTDLRVDGFEMVLRHPDIPFPSYAHEWCPEMLKDAALTIIEILTELYGVGLTLKDPNPGNVLFDGARPVYVDVASIIPIEASNKRASFDCFCRYALFPLILMSEGQERIARWLLWAYEGVRKEDVLILTSSSMSSPIISALRKEFSAKMEKRGWYPYRRLRDRVLCSLQSILTIKSKYQEALLASWDQMRREIEGFNFGYLESRDTNGGFSVSPHRRQTSDVTTKNLNRILDKIRPASILDVESACSRHCEQAASLGSKVVALGIDSTSSTELYREARDSKLPILPLVMDFTRPTPALGLSNECFIAASERLRCEVVLALGVVDHIRRLNFDQIVEGLALFSTRWAIVEFIPNDDPEVKQLWWPQTGWNPLDIVLKTLGKQFQNITSIPSDSSGRLLLICEK